MNLVGRLRAAKGAEAKAARNAPAKFQRITPETEITVPCVLAKSYTVGTSKGWTTRVLRARYEIGTYQPDYTHWLPIQWPEVRG